MQYDQELEFNTRIEQRTRNQHFNLRKKQQQEPKARESTDPNMMNEVEKEK